MGWIELKALSLNELGDFLAGVFGPLSIFWLVLRFFQQGSELRLQVTEMARSVEQQKELVGVTRETLDYERDLQSQNALERKAASLPRFTIIGSGGIISGGGQGRVTSSFAIVNIGAPASEVSIKITPTPIAGGFHFITYWEKGEKQISSIQFIEKGQIDAGGMTIRFKDDLGNQHALSYRFERKVDDLTAFDFKLIGSSEGEILSDDIF